MNQAEVEAFIEGLENVQRAENFVCILNPSGENVRTTMKLIEEAHSIATLRSRRKVKN